MLTAFCADLEVDIFYHLQWFMRGLRNLMPTLRQRRRDITKLLQRKYAPSALQQINVPLCAARTKCGTQASSMCRVRKCRTRIIADTNQRRRIVLQPPAPSLNRIFHASLSLAMSTFPLPPLAT